MRLLSAGVRHQGEAVCTSVPKQSQRHQELLKQSTLPSVSGVPHPWSPPAADQKYLEKTVSVLSTYGLSPSHYPPMTQYNSSHGACTASGSVGHLETTWSLQGDVPRKCYASLETGIPGGPRIHSLGTWSDRVTTVCRQGS